MTHSTQLNRGVQFLFDVIYFLAFVRVLTNLIMLWVCLFKSQSCISRWVFLLTRRATTLLEITSYWAIVIMITITHLIDELFRISSNLLVSSFLPFGMVFWWKGFYCLFCFTYYWKLRAIGRFTPCKKWILRIQEVPLPWLYCLYYQLLFRI